MLRTIITPRKLRRTGSYQYDDGTTTEPRLKVISEDEVATKGKAIEVLARNTAPIGKEE